MEAATATRPTIFVSPCPNLTLTMKPARFEKKNVEGNTITPPYDGFRVEFERGRAEISGEVEMVPHTERVPLKDQADRVVLDEDSNPMFEDVEREHRIHKTFVNGHEIAGVDANEVIAWLRGHNLLNKPENNGFWEEGSAPDEPRPTSAEQMTAIALASAHNDLRGIREVLATEESTHQRAPVLAAARSVIAALEVSDDATVEAPAGEPD